MKDIVAVHIAEGFEEIEAITIIDVLRRAEIETLTVSISGKKEVTGAHDIPILTDTLFEEVNYDQIKMIVLPGGMPGSSNLNNHEALKKQIIQFNNSNKPLGAICAAPMVLGQLKLLDGRRATCFPGFESHLMGAEITGNPVEISGNIITGKGAGVAMQFALSIVEMLKGKPVAEQLADKMIYSEYTTD